MSSETSKHLSLETSGHLSVACEAECLGGVGELHGEPTDKSAMILTQARSSLLIMGIDNHMITEDRACPPTHPDFAGTLGSYPS